VVLGWKKVSPKTRWDDFEYKFKKIEQREDETCFLFEIIDKGKNTGDEEVFYLDDLSDLEIISSAQTQPLYTEDIAEGPYDPGQKQHPFRPDQEPHPYKKD